LEQSLRGHRRPCVGHEADREVTHEHRASSAGQEAIERADGPRASPLTRPRLGNVKAVTEATGPPALPVFSITSSSVEPEGFSRRDVEQSVDSAPRNFRNRAGIYWPHKRRLPNFRSAHNR